MNESCRKERWSKFEVQPRKLLFLKSGWSIPHLEADEKEWKKSLGMLQKEHSTDVFFCTCLQIVFWDPQWFHVISYTSWCMWFKQGFFCHRLFGNMSDSFEPNLVEGMEELYFGADQVSIPGSDDSAGRAQYYVESYVYEPEEPVNAPGLGENSEATSAESSTTQMPILPGCFITASGTCVHSSGCHHGKRAEVQKIPVRFCECFSESGFRHLPHTTEVFLDFRDFLHQSRFCEAFSRRHHPLSQMAVKRIVKKCRHCFWAQISAGRPGVVKRNVFFECCASGSLHVLLRSRDLISDIFHVCGSRIALSFPLIWSHFDWKNVWNTRDQYGSFRAWGCRTSTRFGKCFSWFSWRGRWRRGVSQGRRWCGLDSVLRTKSYDRDWVSVWRSVPCGSSILDHWTSATGTGKYNRCLQVDIGKALGWGISIQVVETTFSISALYHAWWNLA